MQASSTTDPPGATAADTIAIGVFAGEEAPDGAAAQVRELLASGEASGTFKSLGLAHADGKRWLAVGLGKRAELSAESVRSAAAVACERAREIATRTLCWQVPAGVDGVHAQELATALVEGTMLANYRFERFKSTPGGDGSEPKSKPLEALLLSAPDQLGDAVARAAVVAEAVNSARDLQNRPANDL